jgi:hypothetical protein
MNCQRALIEDRSNIHPKNIDQYRSGKQSAAQLPASAGRRTTSAAIHKAIQIRKFLASATSVAFMAHPLFEFTPVMGASSSPFA